MAVVVYMVEYKHKKRASLLHRTATTWYRCFDQDLTEFPGSWSCRTYPTAKVQLFFILHNTQSHFNKFKGSNTPRLMTFRREVCVGVYDVCRWHIQVIRPLIRVLCVEFLAVDIVSFRQTTQVCMSPIPLVLPLR